MSRIKLEKKDINDFTRLRKTRYLPHTKQFIYRVIENFRK